MAALILVDESGDLGSKGTRFFTISSIVVSKSRDLLSVSRAIPSTLPEHKFHNSTDSERMNAIEEYSHSKSVVVCAVIEKNNPVSNHCIYGIKLYQTMLYNVLDLAFSQLTTKDVNVIVDGSRNITDSKLREICEELSMKHNRNLKKCRKGISQNEPCLRVMDYVAGSIGAEYEREDIRFTDVFREKISVARKY